MSPDYQRDKAPTLSQRQLLAYIAKELNEGIDSRSLIHDIIAKGYDPADAQQKVGEVLSSQKRKFLGIFGFSAGFFLLGTIITVGSLDSGSGFVWYGAIICGFIGVVYGLNNFWKLK